VPEYLIKKADAPDLWPAIPKDRLLDVLAPRGYRSERVDGLGDLRLALDGCEMAFSGEYVGWQIWFEGSIAGHDTDALVSQIARQVQEFAGERIEWVRIE
jgi:hypothetical protein